ncbi:hypothetical protein [uncultured Microbacterium sp.]|uniref:hypothetical protein n=1 Tax=uncultured Microbacterium sp. TaxID=191216 RepID=UPI0025F9856C|nr:hypothetical protein [uncultured Microbacterium sp.]
MQIFDVDLGSVSDCVAAVAAVAGSVLSVWALRFGLAANRTAEQTRQDAKAAADAAEARERDRDAADAERDRRLIAGSVAAWWAADRSEEPLRYGVIIANQSAALSVFYDVDVHVTPPAGGKHVIHMNVLPPGQFFVQHRIGYPRSTWERLPVPVRSTQILDPLTVAGDRSVDLVEFSDGLGTRWRWRPREGLSQETGGRSGASGTHGPLDVRDAERVAVQVAYPAGPSREAREEVDPHPAASGTQPER